jgi:hypothetical protein
MLRAKDAQGCSRTGTIKYAIKVFRRNNTTCQNHLRVPTDMSSKYVNLHSAQNSPTGAAGSAQACENGQQATLQYKLQLHTHSEGTIYYIGSTIGMIPISL